MSILGSVFGSLLLYGAYYLGYPKRGHISIFLTTTHAVKGFRVEGLGWNMVSGWFMLGFPLPYVRGMRIMALQLLAA